MRRPLFPLVTFALLAGGCESTLEEPIPEKPNWVEHVEPILRGNCFHCHGAIKPDLFGQMVEAQIVLRWDLYNKPDAFMKVGLAPPLIVAMDPLFVSAKDHVGAEDEGSTILGRVRLEGGNRMPPPPAKPLSDREVEIITRWKDTGREMGALGADNQPPTARWIEPLKKLLIEDGDHQQVVGKLTCGPMGRTEVPILRSGLLNLDGLTAPCKAVLTDGEGVAPVDPIK